MTRTVPRFCSLIFQQFWAPPPEQFGDRTRMPFPVGPWAKGHLVGNSMAAGLDPSAFLSKETPAFVTPVVRMARGVFALRVWRPGLLALGVQLMAPKIRCKRGWTRKQTNGTRRANHNSCTSLLLSLLPWHWKVLCSEMRQQRAIAGSVLEEQQGAQTLKDLRKSFGSGWHKFPFRGSISFQFGTMHFVPFSRKLAKLAGVTMQ